MGEKGIAIAAIAVGYVLVPPLARAWPSLVNGFLFLILFGSILNRRDVWLPLLARLGGNNTDDMTYTAARPGTPLQPR